MSSQLWHEAWLATRFGDQSRIDALLGGIMSREDFYGDEPGFGPSGPAGELSPAIWCTCGKPGTRYLTAHKTRCVFRRKVSRLAVASGPELLCTCNAPHSPDWRAHPEGCPRRAYLYRGGDPAARPGHGPLCGCAPCARDRIVTETLAVLREPVGLPEEDLPAYGTAPDGTCGKCHLGPLYKMNRCVYCYRLEHPLSEPPATRPELSPLNMLIALAQTLIQTLIETAQPRTTRNGRCTRCTAAARHVHTRRCQNISMRHSLVSVVIGALLVYWLVLLLRGAF